MPRRHRAQGGSLNGGTPAPCLGGSEVPGACGFATRTFQAPLDMSYQQAGLLWQGVSSDYADFNGCSGVAPGVQDRARGTGTRGTFCTNLYGPFSDTCSSGNVGQVDAISAIAEIRHCQVDLA